jgi:hypothetical protein
MSVTIKSKKQKIEYTDELADEIIHKFNLKPEVKKVWKTRGHIPGAYVTGDIDTTGKVKPRDPVVQKIVAILGMEEINTSRFRTLMQKGSDVVRGKSTMTQDEVIGMKTEINELRKLASEGVKSVGNAPLKTFFSDARIKPTNIISNEIYLKIVNHSTRSELTQKEKEQIKLELSNFYNKLRL